MSRLWEQAIKNEFLENLIKEVKELHSYEDGRLLSPSSKDRTRYYESIGKYVCQELHASFEEDFEI